MKILRRIKESIFHRIILRFNLLPAYSSKTLPLIFAPHAKMKLFQKGDIISDHIAFLHYYEWELSEIIFRLCPKATIMVDVGANLGYFSLIFLENNPSGNLIAYEPNKLVREILIENIHINKFENRVSIKSYAVAEKSIFRNFDVSSAVQSGWGKVNDTGHGDLVECVSLDDEYYDTELMVDILKIDVEGFEPKVIEGAKKMLMNKRIFNVFFELNTALLEANHSSFQLLSEFFHNCGYKVDLLKADLAHAYLLK